jgi:hypothetical protein
MIDLAVYNSKLRQSLKAREAYCLYTVAHDANGPVKIASSGDPIQRLANLQGGNPQPLSLWFMLWSRSCGKLEIERIEQAVRLHFFDKKVLGDWFDISPEAAEREIRATSRKLFPHLEFYVGDSAGLQKCA